MFEFQYKNSTRWWYHQWQGLNLLKPRSYLGIIQKASQTKFHQIRITKSWKKSHSCSNSSTKMRKTKMWEKFLVYKTGQEGDNKSGQVLGITKRGNEGFKQGQLKGFQIGAKRLKIGARISNRGKKISNRGRDHKSEQEGFQIGTGIINRCRTMQTRRQKNKTPSISKVKQTKVILENEKCILKKK